MAGLQHTSQWDDWGRGEGCPFCPPRPASSAHWDFIIKLDVSSLYLSGNQTYRGRSLLVLDIRHVTRPDQLSPGEWAAFCVDLYAAENALMAVLQPDHINIEILGNVVPHLHWQIVPRYRNDPRWGGPIWTTTVEEMPVTHLPLSERTELIQKLQDAVTKPEQGLVQ